MEYFKYILYFVLGHMLLSFVYRGYIYYLYKTFDVRFKKQSMFFSLVRSEIKENITTTDEGAAQQGLKRLLVLHTVLSITGKIIMLLIVLVVLLFLFAKTR
jgi:hypothetical protein